MISDPTAPRAGSTVPGPLPSSTGTSTARSAESAPIEGAEGASTSRPDGAAASAELRETEARREGAGSTSARDAYLGRVERLRTRIRGLSGLPDDQARSALSEILTEARTLETSGDANFIVDDLIAIRRCYRDLSHGAESAVLRNHPEYSSIATSLTRVESTMRATRDIFRGAIEGSGSSSMRDRLYMSRLALRLSRDLNGTAISNDDRTREGTELLRDYRNELRLLEDAGSEDLPDRDRADRLARDISELFDLRRGLRQVTTPTMVEGRDFALITHDASAVIGDLESLIQNYSSELVRCTRFIESPGASDAIRRLINNILSTDQESLLPRLSAEGLTEYCRLSAEAESAVERARGLSDPAQRRTALAEALRSFVALGDSGRVNDVFDQMLASLPEDASDLLRLQVFTGMGSILHGSDMSAEDRLRDLASPIARRMASAPIGSMYREEIEADDFIGPGGMTHSYVTSRTLVNERAYLDASTSILAVRAYYSAIGESGSAASTDETLRTLRSHLVDQIGSTSSPRIRLEVAASTVEIDMALNGIASSEHLRAWRTAIGAATELSTDDRLSQARTLLRVATLCRREAESSGSTRSDLTELNTWATQIIGDIAADRMRHLSAEHRIDPEFSDAVIADFRTRLGRAVSEGDASWLGALDEHGIDQFADLAQSGHVLLVGRHTPPTRRELQACLQAAAIFGRLGLNDRVTESMAPLLTHAESIDNPSERASFYLSLGQVLQEAGMSSEANQMLDRIAALDVSGAPRELHRLAEMVPAMREMNLGHLDRARELLAGIHGNPRAEEMLRNVEGAIRRARSLQILDALRIVASDYLAQERERGSTAVASSEREIRDALDEAQRLILSGRCSSVREALGRFHTYGVRDMLWESRAAGPIDSLLNSGADISLSDNLFSDRMLGFASSLSTTGRYYSAASQLGNLLARNPHTRAGARSLIDSIPGEARMHGILTELGNMTIIFAESDSAAIRSGVVTLATFGLGRLAASAAEMAYAAYVTESAIASSMALRAGGFLVRSGAEAATFTLSNMAFETLFTGRTDHWSLENFGRQFGSMMVTFMFCHGIGMATSGIGSAAARTSLLGEVAAEGGRTLNLSGRIAVGTLGYGATLTGLTGVEYLNEALGLHPAEGDVPFLTRLLGSAVMDAQMRLAGRMFNEATGGAVERWDATTRQRYAIHELLPAVERLGFGRPNASGELSPEGMTALNAMLMRVARGESPSDVAASVSRESAGDLSRITSMVLGVDANSAEGRRLQALLFSYRASHPDVDLAETAGRLQIEANRLARAAGLREGPAYDIVRAELFRRALSSGSTAEGMSAGGEAFAALRPELEGLTDELLGRGGARSVEGQRLIGELLLRTLDRADGLSIAPGTAEAIRDQVRGMGLDPTSAAGRRMAADLMLSRVAPESERLSLELNSEAGSSRLEGGVLHIDFSNPGFRHVSFADHGEIWFGETANAGEIRIDNHTGSPLIVIRARDLPEGSTFSMTQTLAPEGAETPAGWTVARPGDRIRFADGREIVLGAVTRPERRAASPVEPRIEPARDEESTRPGIPSRVRGTEEGTRPGIPSRIAREEAPVIPLEPRRAPAGAEPDLLAAFRHADPSEAPSRELLRRSFTLADRLARELGLSDPHDASVSRPFREAMARRAATGPITASDLREVRDSFRALDASLHGVDPMMRTEIRRRIFTRMLSGEIPPERGRELARQVREGEIRLETGPDGGLNIIEIPAEGRGETRDLARRRIFEHLAERHFPEAVATRLNEARAAGTLSLERLQEIVDALPTLRRWISSGGVEPSSPAGSRILSRTVLGLAEGRLEIREGRVVEARRAEPPATELSETAGGADTPAPLPAEAESLVSRHFPETIRDSLRAGFRDGSINLARLQSAVDALPTIRTFIADSGTEPSSREGGAIVNRVVLDLAVGRLEFRDGRIVRPGTEVEPSESLGRDRGTVVEGARRGGAGSSEPIPEGPLIGGSGGEGVRLEGDTLHIEFGDAGRPFRNATIPGLGGPLRFALTIAGSVMLLNTSGENITVVRPEARDEFPAQELIQPETATRHPGRTELLSGDRLRLADGTEIVLHFDIPAEGAARPEAGNPPPDSLDSGGGGGTVVLRGRRAPIPPPGESAAAAITAVEVPRPPREDSPILPPAPDGDTPVVIPAHDRLPDVNIERVAYIDTRLLEEAFPPGIPRPRFGFFTPAREVEATVEGLSTSGESEIGARIRADLESLQSSELDSPEFEAATRRLGRLLNLRNNEAPFSNSPDVASMPADIRYRFAERAGELYGLRPQTEAPAELAAPPVDHAAIERARAEFLQSQRRGATDWATEHGLGDNAAFRGRLTMAISGALRQGETGFPNAEARATYLRETETRARTLAEAAGRGEDATFVSSLTELLRGTTERADAFFHPAAAESPSIPPPAEPAEPAPVAPVIPLRRLAPAVAEPSRRAAFATDVAVMGDTVLIGEEVFSLRTETADAVMGEVPPVARTVFRFTNTTLTGGSGVAIALPSTYTAEAAARMVSHLSPSVRRSLSRMRPTDAGRIVEISEGMRETPASTSIEAFSLPEGPVGSGVGGTAVCTGEILGVGSGRTTFRGYVAEPDGTRRPVAIVMITHSMGGSFENEARNLSRLEMAGVGEVRFDGTIRLDGRRALVVNLAEGTAHVGLGDLSVRDRADFNPLMARDLARMAIAGYTSGSGTDFQYIWGRDARGRPHLQWIDTESSVIAIDEGRSAELRTRLGRDTLTAQDWYLENLRGFGLYNPSTGRFAEGVPETFQAALRLESSGRRDRSSTIPPPP